MNLNIASPNRCKQKTREYTPNEYVYLIIDSKFVLSLILYKTASIFLKLTDCKDTVVVVPAGCGKSAILYDRYRENSSLVGRIYSYM